MAQSSVVVLWIRISVTDALEIYCVHSLSDPVAGCHLVEVGTEGG